MPTAPRKVTAKLGAAWMSETDIRLTLVRIADNRNKHDAIVRRSKIDIERREKQVRDSLSGIDGRDKVSIIKKAANGRRKELVAETKDARLAFTRELATLAERVKSAAAHYRSPVQMLMRDTLGSERRTHLQQQIANSGPVELASLAELAAATKDRELAAALCGRVQGLKRDDRPFDAGELADIMCGDLHRELSQAMIESERRVLEALQSDQDFETGSKNPHRGIEIALLKKREAKIAAYVADDEDDADDEKEGGEGDTKPTEGEVGLDRIEAGLAARRASQPA